MPNAARLVAWSDGSGAFPDDAVRVIPISSRVFRIPEVWPCGVSILGEKPMLAEFAGLSWLWWWQIPMLLAVPVVWIPGGGGTALGGSAVRGKAT